MMNSCGILVDDDVIIDEIGFELLLNCYRYIGHMMDFRCMLILLLGKNFEYEVSSIYFLIRLGWC